MEPWEKLGTAIGVMVVAIGQTIAAVAVLNGSPCS